MTRRFLPTLFVALFNVAAFVAAIGFHLAFDTPFHLINRWIMPGVDYRDFYQASLHILHGESPYLVWRYVTPPLFAFANLPLSLPGFDAARLIFTALIPITVLVSYVLIHRALHDATDEWHHLMGLLAILFSFPLYFLFERGNVDGIVLLCMCLGIVLLPARPWLGGLFLAAAIHFKLYPILLFIPLLLARRWKPLLWVGGWTLLFVLLFLPYWREYVTVISSRSNSFQLFENGSLVNTLLFAGKLLGTFFQGQPWLWSYAPAYAAVLFGILLGMLAFADRNNLRADGVKMDTATALAYFPFMVALPKSVYHYEFVVLLPLLPLLDYFWKEAATTRQRCSLGIAAAGLALTQWQAVALYDVTGNIAAYYIPGFGLLLTMAGISLHALLKMEGRPAFGRVLKS